MLRFLYTLTELITHNGMTPFDGDQIQHYSHSGSQMIAAPLGSGFGFKRWLLGSRVSLQLKCQITSKKDINLFILFVFG